MVNNKWLIWVWYYINLYASTKGRYDLLISCQSALEVNEREYVNDMYCSLLIMGFTDMHVTCTSKVNDPSIEAWNAQQKFWSTHAFFITQKKQYVIIHVYFWNRYKKGPYASTKGRYDLLISCQSALEVNEREYVNDMYCSLLIIGFTDMHVTCTSKVNDPVNRSMKCTTKVLVHPRLFHYTKETIRHYSCVLLKQFIESNLFVEEISI